MSRRVFRSRKFSKIEKKSYICQKVRTEGESKVSKNNKNEHSLIRTIMTHLLLFGNLGWPELIIILLVILLIFGGKKIPELMKGMGKGVRSFKEGLNEVEKQIDQPTDNPDKKE